MTQNNFLGTIGWIKGNLLTSSDIGEKYSNENFYPGAPNIPDSAGPVPIAILGKVTGAIDENNILGPAGYYTFTNQYSFLPNESNSVQGIQITFKLLKNYTGGQYKNLVCYLKGSVYKLALGFRFHSDSGKYKMRFLYSENGISESDPVVEIGNWYTCRVYRDIETNKAITMQILQGSNLVYSNKFSYSSVISEPRMKYIFTPSTLTNLKYEDWCQVDLKGDKTFIW